MGGVWRGFGEGQGCFTGGEPGMFPLGDGFVSVVFDGVCETDPAVAVAGESWCERVVLECFLDFCFVCVGQTGVRDVHVLGKVEDGDLFGEHAVW